MKNIIFLIVIGCLVTTTLFGQTVKQQKLEIKTLLPELMSTFNLGLEYIPTKRFGAEINAGIRVDKLPGFSQKNDLFSADFYSLLKGRFYLSPRSRADGLYIGTYTLYEYAKNDISLDEHKVEHTGIIGGMFGYKWLNKSGFSVDITLGRGFGRKLVKIVNRNELLLASSNELVDSHIIQLTLGYRFYL